MCTDLPAQDSGLQKHPTPLVPNTRNGAKRSTLETLETSAGRAHLSNLGFLVGLELTSCVAVS